MPISPALSSKITSKTCPFLERLQKVKPIGNVTVIFNKCQMADEFPTVFDACRASPIFLLSFVWFIEAPSGENSKIKCLKALQGSLGSTVNLKKYTLVLMSLENRIMLYSEATDPRRSTPGRYRFLINKWPSSASSHALRMDWACLSGPRFRI